MSIKLNTEHEILNFLSKVSHTHNLHEETDTFVEKYKSDYAADKSLYNLDKVKEEPQEADEEVEIETDVEEKETSQRKSVNVSFDALVRAVNDLRSGQSMKSGDIKQQAADYYDSLDEDERDLLVLFIKELGDILTGDIEGSVAAKPGYQKPKVTPPTTTKKVEVEVEREEERESSPEDTTPPIKVNESQDIALIKQKFELLSRKK